MRLINIFLIFLLTIIIVSCTRDEFDSGIIPEKPESIVSYEYLNTYNVLKAYVDTNSNQEFKIGAYLKAGKFLESGPIFSLIKTNFTEIALYDVFNHGSIVKDDGTKDFSIVDTYIERAKANNLDIFGLPLCWHSEQNGIFLNDRYGPRVFETPSFPNLLDKSGIEDGTFTGWDKIANNGGSIETTMYNGDNVVKLTSGASSSNPDDLRLTSSSVTVTETTFEVTMFILSDKGGAGRITFEGLNNNTPKLDWTGSGAKSDTFSINQGWNKINFQLNDFAAESFKFHLDLGYRPDVKYYVHIGGLSIVDVNGEFENPDEIFLEVEDGIVGSQWTILDDTDASGGKYTIVPDNNNSNLDSPGDDPINNISHTFMVNTPGAYKFWVRGKGPSASDDSFYSKVDTNNWSGALNGILNSSYGWHLIDTFDFAIGEHTVIISRREDGTILDRLYFTLTDATPTDLGSPAAKTNKINLDLEEAERITAIGGYLTNYISALVTRVKEDVNAWVVVNEPMDDVNPAELKTGNGAILDDKFYWQDYLGKDYGVMAFNSARASAKQGDLLFISDYGLESNLDKCNGLIDYVNYLENQGVTVDGIATQLHLSLNSNIDNILSMFELLAATGKLIKIAQLEVTIPEGFEITEETLQLQAAMYKNAVNSYFKNVPSAQRYGIDIIGLIDSNNNINGLWNTSYNRKPAYAGFADGLIENEE